MSYSHIQLDPCEYKQQREADWDRLLAAIGACRTLDGATDISSRHDEYLSESYAHD